MYIGKRLLNLCQINEMRFWRDKRISRSSEQKTTKVISKNVESLAVNKKIQKKKKTSKNGELFDLDKVKRL